MPRYGAKRNRSEADEVDITENQRGRIKFQKKECARANLSWKAHLARSVAQEDAMEEALVQLDQEKCSIIIDCAMKYLPQRSIGNRSDVRVFRQTRQEPARWCRHNAPTCRGEIRSRVLCAPRQHLQSKQLCSDVGHCANH